jgi:hypothetical protein
MNNDRLRKITLNAFAVVIFLFGIFYIANAKQYSVYFNSFPAASILIYISAFVDIAIASSIFTKQKIKIVCFNGGIYWIISSALMLIFEIASDASNQINLYLMTFVSSLGFSAAILYIGSVED